MRYLLEPTSASISSTAGPGHEAILRHLNGLLYALSLQCTLVTNNEKEFQRIPDLKVKNWTR